MKKLPNAAEYRGSGSGRGKDHLSFEQQWFFKEAAYFISKVETRIFPSSTSVKVTLEKGHQNTSSSAVSCLDPPSPSLWGPGPGLQVRFSPLLRQRASVLQPPGSCCLAEQWTKPSHLLRLLLLGRLTDPGVSSIWESAPSRSRIVLNFRGGICHHTALKNSCKCWGSVEAGEKGSLQCLLSVGPVCSQNAGCPRASGASPWDKWCHWMLIGVHPGDSHWHASFFLLFRHGTRG